MEAYAPRDPDRGTAGGERARTERFHLAADQRPDSRPRIPRLRAGPHRHRRGQGPGNHRVPASQSGLHHHASIRSSPSPLTPTARFANALPFVSASYLHERQHKRELRLESAQQGNRHRRSPNWRTRNAICCSTCATPSSRPSRPRPCWRVARENLAYYDRLLGVSGDRFKAGDIARVDLDRLELQRVQFETDVQTGEVNVRTAKIQLLTLLNDRTPIEQFDVTGPFDFSEPLITLEELHKIALASRPDLQSRGASRRQGQDRLPAGGGQRLLRIRRSAWMWGAILRSRRTSASASRFRCGSSTATRARRRARNWTSGGTSVCRRRERPGVQRRGFGVGDAEQQPGAAAALQGQLSEAGHLGSRDGFLRVSKRRIIAARFSERAERLPEHVT